MLRRLLVFVAASLTLLVSATAWAGSYLDRSALLLEANRRDAHALRDKMTDKELARVVRIVADARETAASEMDVPAAVAKAHPHLLLALAKVERAAKAALDGNYSTVVELLDTSAREETLFRAALKELGFPLPKTQTKRVFDSSTSRFLVPRCVVRRRTLWR